MNRNVTLAEKKITHFVTLIICVRYVWKYSLSYVHLVKQAF